MSLRKRLAVSAFAALLSLATACSNSTSSPPPAPDAGDVAESGPPDVDVDGPLTTEGCHPGESCDCVGGVSACQGGPQQPQPCNMQRDCDPTGQSQSMLCIPTDGGAGVCATRCAKAGGCGGASCPGGYVCQQAPIGPPYPVCIIPSMLQPPACNQDADCAAIPGAKCMTSGNGIACILVCAN